MLNLSIAITIELTKNKAPPAGGALFYLSAGEMGRSWNSFRMKINYPVRIFSIFVNNPPAVQGQYENHLEERSGHYYQ